MSIVEFMKQKKVLKYNRWNYHLKNTIEISNYSIRGTDLMINSISGAGIYIIFETLRGFKTVNIEIENSNLLLFSGILFYFGIISNFISQLTSYNFDRKDEVGSLNSLA